MDMLMRMIDQTNSKKGVGKMAIRAYFILQIGIAFVNTLAGPTMNAYIEIFGVDLGVQASFFSCLYLQLQLG